MGMLDADLEFVKALAEEATVVALDRASRVAPEEKANKSFVTDLDLALEAMIRERLGNRFPDDQLTGEEYADSGGHGGRRWSIDPIDGTGNLVHQLPLWAISIGLLDQGEPVLGVIAIPPLKELFWATRGGGAWRDGQRINARDAESFHTQDNLNLGTNAMRAVDLDSVTGRLRDLGSACCEMTFTACGRLVASTFLGEMAHDVAAGVVICAEAGCQFGTIDGRLLSPSEMVAQTPVPIPTFVAPPGRLASLMAHARLRNRHVPRA